MRWQIRFTEAKILPTRNNGSLFATWNWHHTPPASHVVLCCLHYLLWSHLAGRLCHFASLGGSSAFGRRSQCFSDSEALHAHFTGANSYSDPSEEMYPLLANPP